MEHLGGVKLICQQVFFGDPQKVNGACMVRSPTNEILDDTVAFAHEIDACPSLVMFDPHHPPTWLDLKGNTHSFILSLYAMNISKSATTYIASHRESPKVACMFHLFQSGQSCIHPFTRHVPIIPFQNHDCGQNLSIRQFESLTKRRC